MLSFPARPIPPAPHALPPPPPLKTLLKIHANPQRAPAPIRATPTLTPLSYAEAAADLELMAPRRSYYNLNGAHASTNGIGIAPAAPSGPFTYQPTHVSEEEAYARPRGVYAYRTSAPSQGTFAGPSAGSSASAGVGAQYPPALVHSYVVAPAPAWDGSTGRRRERERDVRERERDREPIFDSPVLGTGGVDKDDKRPQSASTSVSISAALGREADGRGWTTTGERELDLWDREQTREREWQQKLGEKERDPPRGRERERERERDIQRERERDRDRDRDREQREREREREQRERERERERPLSTPFTMQPFAGMTAAADAEMGRSL